MKTRTLMLFGVSALMLGGTMVGCSKAGSHVASAGQGVVVADAGKAAKVAADARDAMAKHKADDAVRFAEAAVTLSPRDANYRALLGQAYLSAGRFQSATQAFTDTLTLDPSNGRAALNLALAQTALGDWATARKTLADNADRISTADRGLALALAGDPNGAIQLLAVAARDPSATATVRQNFALALALGGHWQEARAVAAVDLSPDQVDQRLGEWAQFARPRGAADQVAAMLGVVPVADQGQPVQLALTAPVALGAPDAVLAGGDAAGDADKVTGGDADGSADYGAALADSAGDVAGSGDGMVTGGGSSVVSGSGVQFAPPKEIAQAVPAPVPAPRALDLPKFAPKLAPKPGKGVVAKSADDAIFAPAKGSFYVQLGAYDNAGVARDAWNRISGRTPKLAGLSPSGMGVTVQGKNFYRLSVGGFARGDADKVCAAVKAGGGRCFVRTGAGDQMASWVKGGKQVASR